MVKFLGLMKFKIGVENKQWKLWYESFAVASKIIAKLKSRAPVKLDNKDGVLKAQHCVTRRNAEGLISDTSTAITVQVSKLLSRQHSYILVTPNYDSRKQVEYQADDPIHPLDEIYGS